jgi:hypothetical protein
MFTFVPFLYLFAMVLLSVSGINSTSNVASFFKVTVRHAPSMLKESLGLSFRAVIGARIFKKHDDPLSLSVDMIVPISLIIPVNIFLA